MDETEYKIEYHLNSFANIEKITKVNEKDVYQIIIDNCLRYIFVDSSTIYIAMKHRDVFHIFNLIHDGDFPEDLKKSDNIKCQ